MCARDLFEKVYGVPPMVEVGAPGRVNLIGEHTDYNGGFAMPIATTQTTKVAMRPNDGVEVRAASKQIDGGAVNVHRAGGTLGSFVSYVQGAYWALREAGYSVSPVDVAVSSDVPMGSGLSSSAALLVALLRAFRLTFDLRLSDLEVAKLAHRAERDFVGVPVGTLDQMASSLGSTESALLLNTLNLSYEKVPLPPDVELVVVDSGVRHSHASGGYRKRREECERAAKLLGVRWLCDAADYSGALPEWPQLDGLLRRRVRHVLSENQRVFTAAAAMRGGDVVTLGRCLDESHASLRDDFDVSTPAVDELVVALRSREGCLGARLTGGGFGGAVVAVTRRGAGERVASEGAAFYAARCPSVHPTVICPRLEAD